MVVFLELYCNYPNTACKYINFCQEILFFLFLISFKVSGLVRILGRPMITSLIYNRGNCDSFIHLFIHSTKIYRAPLMCHAGESAVN